MMSKSSRRPITPDVPSLVQPEPEPEPPTLDAVEPEDNEPERGPLRRCVVSRQRHVRETMIRFVVGPDRALVPDLAAKLPGRGIWLSASRDVIEGARGAKGGVAISLADPRGGLARAFARAARGPVILPANLIALLEAGLERRVADTLGLARRAGQAVAGFAKARDWIVAGRAGLVIQARDGSPTERARLVGSAAIPVAAPLDAVSLGAVFGRDHVVHVAIAHGRLAEALLAEAGRLRGLMGQAAEPRTTDDVTLDLAQPMAAQTKDDTDQANC